MNLRSYTFQTPVILILSLVFVTLMAGAPASAQESDDLSPPEETTEPTEITPVPDAGITTEDDQKEQEPDPCAAPDVVGSSWVDRINRTVRRSVCGSALWFDSFFGDTRASTEYGHSGGRASVHVAWQEHDGFDPRLRFHVNYPLPNLNARTDAFIGRATRDEYLTDAADRSDPGGPLRGFQEDEELLLGLGYNPRRGGGKRYRMSVGVKVDYPPEPYAKFRFFHRHQFNERSQFRWQQTVFWELEDKFGTTTNLDLERRLAEDLFLRWANTGTYSEITAGVEWWSNLTLFHRLDSLRALAYTLWITGASDAPVDTQEVGARVVMRRRVYREWLFVDFGPIVSFPRYKPEEGRDASWGAIVGVEMVFGELPW